MVIGIIHKFKRFLIQTIIIQYKIIYERIPDQWKNKGAYTKKGVFNFKILKTEIFNNFKHFSVLNLNTV